MVHNSLVYQLSDSTEAVIQRRIEGIQRMIKIHNSPNQGEEEEEQEEEPAIKINPAMKRHWESERKILRDADKLREILKVREEEYEKAEGSEDIKRLVPEIEMLSLYCFWYVERKDKKIIIQNNLEQGRLSSK